MSEMSTDYEDYLTNAYEQNVNMLVTDDSGNKFSSPVMSSPNFDGYIPVRTASIAVVDVTAGRYIGIDNSGQITFYPIMNVSKSNPLLGETAQYDIYYLADSALKQLSYTSSTSSVVIRYEDWNDKILGNSGWTISPEGNAIFTNIAVRGRIEATSGYIGNTTSGWQIGSNILSNASVGFFAPSVTTGSDVAMFAGSASSSRSTAPFQVRYNGTVVAQNASISGDIVATSGRFTGSVVAQHITASNGNVGGWSLSASILAGTNASIVNTGNIILGTGQTVVKLSSSDANFRLWAGSATPTTAPFRVTALGGLVATTASITGNITANSGQFTGSIGAQHITASTGTIAGFSLANNQMSTASIVVSSSGGFRLGNPTLFSVDQFGNLVAQNASITGRINATSGSFSGDITAAAGRFTGSVSINTGGLLYVGNLASQRVVMSDSGIFAFHSNGLEAFALPISGSPRIGTFRIIPTGIVSQSASNANLILGDVDGSGSATSGIVLRGFRSTSASIAIYSIQNGVPTDFSSGNGFYVDENARFKLKGNTGSLSFDGNNLSITGDITANSGRFTGSISAQHITASTGLIAGFTLANNQMSTASVIVSSSGGFRLGNPTVFSVDQFGSLVATNASITGDITANTIRATSASLNGNLLIFGSGTLYASESALLNGQRVVIDKNGVAGYSPIGEQAFYLASGSSSMITDGGFELQGAVGTAIGGAWGTFWGNASCVVEGSIVKGGSKSMRVAAGTGADFLQSVNTSFQTTVGTQYNISAWVYSASPLTSSDGLVEIWVLESYASSYPSYFNSSAALRVITPATYLPARTWTKISGTYVSASPYTTLGLRSYSKTPSAFFIWDSVEVTTGNNISNIAGFSFNEDTLFSPNVSISNQGRATFGVPTTSVSSSVSASVTDTANFLTIDGIDSRYRLWVGNSDPTKAFFSVERDGSVNINQGGDLILTSSAAGTSDTSISRIEFRSSPSGSLGGRISYTPQTQTLQVGKPSSGDLMTTLQLRAGTTGSIVLEGTAYGGQFGGVVTIGTDSAVSSDRLNGHYFGGNNGYAFLRRDSNTQTDSVMFLHKFNGAAGTLTSGSQSMITFVLDGTNRGRLVAFTTGAQPALLGISDRRAKTDIVPFEDASELIKQLNLYSFKWVESGKSESGFIADEVQSVIPSAIMGEPNAIDEDGNPIYQEIAETKLICYTIGALKEALLKIEQLEDRIRLLEDG